MPRTTPPPPACTQIFRFSIWEGRPLPGMALMNLRFRDEAAVQRQRRHALAAAAAAAATGGLGPGSSSAGASSLVVEGLGQGGPSGGLQELAGGRSGVEGPGLSALQRCLYCAGAVLLRYAWARLGHAAAASHWADSGGWARGSWRQRCWELMQLAESAYRLASLANFLAFLRTGRYRLARAPRAAKPFRACRHSVCMCAACRGQQPGRQALDPRRWRPAACRSQHALRPAFTLTGTCGARR